MTAPLTRRQAQVLAYIREFTGEHGYAPSFEEIAEQFSFRSLATVHEHLTNLEQKGHLVRDFHVARGIRLVAPDALARYVREMVGIARRALDDNDRAMARSCLDAITICCQREIGL